MATIRTGLTAILTPTGTFDHTVYFDVPTAVKDGFSLPVTMTTPPAINAGVEKVNQNGWTVNPSDVTPVWVVTPLTPGELSEVNERNQITQIVTMAQDMIGSVGTAAERISRVEVALGRLLLRLTKTNVIP